MYLDLGEKLKEKILEETYCIYDFNGTMINAEEIPSLIEDLIYEIHCRDEQLEDLKQDIQDNYKPIKSEDMYN